MSPARRAPAWRRYLRFWGSNLSSDVEDELRFHLDMRTRDYMGRGMDEDTARAAALARVGAVDAARADMLAIGRENERRARRSDLLDGIATDTRFALRSFGRAPGWTAIAVLTIALGIGSSTAVFSVVDRLLVRPVSYPGSDRIVFVRRDTRIGSNSVWSAPSLEQVDAWRRSARSLDDIEGYGRRELELKGDGDARTVHAASIGPRFLVFAGARPIAGRGFTPDDAVAETPNVVMLAEGFWRREYGAARDVVGKAIETSAGRSTIIGIVPAEVRLPDLAIDPPDLWLPLHDPARLAGVVARLRPSVPLDDAQRELQSILARDRLDVSMGDETTTKLVRPGETLGFRRALWMLSGAVALLLLVASANVAHLLLARGAARERELAVRFALGAGRWRLVQQLLTESLALTLIGGLAAALVAAGGLRLAVAFRPASMTALSHITVNRTVAAIAASLTLATGIAVGLLVGMRTARRGLADSLRAGSGIARATHRLRAGLVVSEIALSATLLVGALLLVHSVVKLQSMRLGFDARNLFGLTYSLRGPAFGSSAERVDFLRRLVDGARRLPDVAGVTLADKVPPKAGYFMGTLETPEHLARTENGTSGGANYVANEYFVTLGISFLGGHTFDARSAARNEIIVNEVLARQLWPDGRAVGGRLRYLESPGTKNPWWTVIGVTRNALTHGLLQGTDEPAIYFPLDDTFENGRVTLIVRGRDGVDPTAAVQRLATELRANAPSATVTNVSRALYDSMAEPRFAMIVLTTFAILGVALAAIGLYGVIAFSVAQRTREIGIRMALGAGRGAIARSVVGDGLRLSVAGVILGLLGATGAARVLESALHGVARGDAWSFAIGAASLVAVALVACVVPLLRATAVDPLAAVRID